MRYKINAKSTGKFFNSHGFVPSDLDLRNFLELLQRFYKESKMVDELSQVE